MSEWLGAANETGVSLGSVPVTVIVAPEAEILKRVAGRRAGDRDVGRPYHGVGREVRRRPADTAPVLEVMARDDRLPGPWTGSARVDDLRARRSAGDVENRRLEELNCSISAPVLMLMAERS